MILLSERYSIDTPGFVSIKWDDSIPKIVDYIEKNMTKSLQDRYDVSHPPNQLLVLG